MNMSARMLDPPPSYDAPPNYEEAISMFPDNRYDSFMSYQQLEVRRGKPLDKLSNWGSVYSVEADITVTKRPTKEQNRINVFYFRPSSYSKYGDSLIPAVFLSSRYFVICSTDDVFNHGGCFSKQFPYTLGKQYHLMIQQIKQNGKTIYTIKVNGNEIFSVENFAVRTFHYVQVYASEPSFEAFTSEYGILSNFKYSTSKKLRST